MTKLVLWIALAVPKNPKESWLQYLAFPSAEEACTETMIEPRTVLGIEFSSDPCESNVGLKSDFRFCLDWVSDRIARGGHGYEIKTYRCIEGKTWKAIEAKP